MNAYFSHGSTEFSIPVEIARCTFIASTLVPTVASDFSVFAEQAVNLDLESVIFPDMYLILENAN